MATQDVNSFKFWANKIIPLVYDDSLSYYEFLCKVMQKLNEVIGSVNAQNSTIKDMQDQIDAFIAAEKQAREDWELTETANRAAWELQQAQKMAAFELLFVSDYDSTKSYTTGNVCRHEGLLYVANGSTTGSWNSSKWDQIVLADYLANYVQTAAADMQAQYDSFLENYQRQFGIVQVAGSSTTDAMSQAGFSTLGFIDRGMIANTVTDLVQLTDIGIYRFNAAMTTLTNMPADIYSTGSGTILVTKCGGTDSNRLYILAENKAAGDFNNVYIGYQFSADPTKIFWHLLKNFYRYMGEETTLEDLMRYDGIYALTDKQINAMTDKPSDVYWTSALYSVATMSDGSKYQILTTIHGETYLQTRDSGGVILTPWKKQHSAVDFNQSTRILTSAESWSNVTSSNGTTFTSSDDNIMSDLVELPGEASRIMIYNPNSVKVRIYKYTDTGTLSSRYPTNGTYTTGNVFHELNSGHDENSFRVEINSEGVLPADISTLGLEIYVMNQYNIPEKIQLGGRRLSILGDSLTSFGGSITDSDSARYSTGEWCYSGNRCRYPQANLLYNVSDMFWYKILTRFNFVYGVNESWAGSMVSWDGTTETTDQGANKYMGSQTRINHLDDNGTPDIILISTGGNDIAANVPLGTIDYSDPQSLTAEQIAALPVDTYADAVKTMLIRVQKTYPKARIIVCPTFFKYQRYTATKINEYHEIVKKICEFMGVICIDLRTAGISIFNARNFLPDYSHPNSAGMNLLYRAVAGAIQNL